MPRCLIALGGNLEASESLFEAALRKLERQGIEPGRLSRVCRTRPVGAAAGDEFLNAAATVECTLEPEQLLAALHEVEVVFGRTRKLHWSPRTLDLDLLLFDERVIDRPELVVPHPAMWYRRFVLEPATDVAAEMVHPILKQSVRELQLALQIRPVRLAVLPGDRRSSEQLNLERVRHCLSATINDIEWSPSDDTPPDSGEYFATIRVYGPSAAFPHRTQPANAASRLVAICADSDDSAIDQLTQLSTAILG